MTFVGCFILLINQMDSSFLNKNEQDSSLIPTVQNTNGSVQITDIDGILKHLYKLREQEGYTKCNNHNKNEMIVENSPSSTNLLKDNAYNERTPTPENNNNYFISTIKGYVEDNQYETTCQETTLTLDESIYFNNKQQIPKYQKSPLKRDKSKNYGACVHPNGDGVNKNLPMQEHPLIQDKRNNYASYPQVYDAGWNKDLPMQEHPLTLDQRNHCDSYPQVYDAGWNKDLPMQEHPLTLNQRNNHNIYAKAYDDNSYLNVGLQESNQPPDNRYKQAYGDGVQQPAVCQESNISSDNCNFYTRPALAANEGSQQQAVYQESTLLPESANLYDIYNQSFSAGLQHHSAYQESTLLPESPNYCDIYEQPFSERLRQAQLSQDTTLPPYNSNYYDICPTVYRNTLAQTLPLQESTIFHDKSNYHDICPKLYDEGTQQQLSYQESTLKGATHNYPDLYNQSYDEGLQQATSYQEKNPSLCKNSWYGTTIQAYDEGLHHESTRKADKRKNVDVRVTGSAVKDNSIFNQKVINTYVQQADNNDADPKDSKTTTAKQPNLSLFSKDIQSKSLPHQENIQELLLDFLKNIFYYRFNLSKILERIKIVSYNKSKTDKHPHKKLLFRFIKVMFEFAINPGELKKTDGAVYNLINKKELEASRKLLIDLMVDPNTVHCNEEYNIIKRYNKKYSTGLKQILKFTNYNIVCDFFVEIIGKEGMITKYYDMFVSVFIPLYKISLFYDTNMKGIFEKHLTSPFFPKSNLNSYYSKIRSHLIFYWAVEWMYFFFNFCNIYPFFNENIDIFASIQKLPKDFFITLLLLLYFAEKHEAGTIVTEDSPDNQQKLKRIISYVFYQPNLFSRKSYREILRYFFTVIQKVHNRKLFNYGSTNPIFLLRTTTEHLQCAIPLEYPLKFIIKELFSTIQQVNTIDRRCPL